MNTEERLALAIDKLREWAAQCSNCGGTGIETFDGAHDDCLTCFDIREVIEKCEAP